MIPVGVDDRGLGVITLGSAQSNKSYHLYLVHTECNGYLPAFTVLPSAISVELTT